MQVLKESLGILVITTNLKETRSVSQRTAVWIAAGCGFLIGIVALWLVQLAQTPAPPSQPPKLSPNQQAYVAPGGGSTTNLYAHNLRLHQGPDFRIYIQWLRGQLKPSHKGVVPSFDDPESFYLNVTNGVIRANMGDVNNYLNNMAKDAPLRDIRMSGKGDQIRITGKLHKLITLPVELLGILQPQTDNRIRVHVAKINVLKIPFKALLGGLHITLADFMKSGHIDGIEVAGNDITFDPQVLMPPPHINGRLTKVSMGDPDFEATYGDATEDVERTEQWRNFLRLEHGALAFGKLTMRDVDLMMVDISQDSWFDLDLANYQAQLVNGYTRITPQAGLQIFMPDVSELKRKDAGNMDIPWLKNRNAAPPSEVVPKQ